MHPTANHLTKMKDMNPLLDYSTSEKALAVLLCVEAYTAELRPWKIGVLRHILTTQEAVDTFRDFLVNMAVEGGLTTLGEDELKEQIKEQFGNSPDAAQWLLAQQEAMPVKHLGRTLLLARNYMAQVVAINQTEGIDLTSRLSLLAFPATIRADYGEGSLWRPSLVMMTSGFNPVDENGSEWGGRVEWLLNAPSACSGYDSHDALLLDKLPTPEPEPPAVQGGGAAAEAVSTPPPANNQALEALKATIATIIKVEANTILAPDKLADVVAKQIAQNPVAIQAALVKVFNISTNQVAAAEFKNAASIALKDFFAAQGKDFLTSLVKTYLQSTLNVAKVEQEAIKALSSNVDGYFAAIFNRVVVHNPAGEVIGTLGFKDKTTLKVPMPKSPLAQGGDPIEDIPF